MPETDWKAIVTAGVVTFLSALENTVIGMSEWSYMNEIDKEADANFFGIASALAKAAHALAALVAAWACWRWQNYRYPLLIGRAIALFACLIYLCVEFLTTGRRYLMMLCYILFGIAASSSTILRSYVAAVSRREDRPQAYTSITSANMLSIIIGPVIQTAFSGIAYPGYELMPNVRLHIFSAPVWIAALTNFVSAPIIVFLLNELPRRQKQQKIQEKGFVEDVAQKMSSLRKLDIDWPIIVLCWFMKMQINLPITTLTTLTSIIFITIYGMSRQNTVLLVSIIMASVGVMSMGVATLYVWFKFGHKVPQRFVFLGSLLTFTLMFVGTYPYDFASSPVALYNSVNDTGCDLRRYDWCATGKTANFFLFPIAIVAVMGVAVPTSQISLDSIYSRALRDIDQSVMQGAMVVAEDLMVIPGPIYSSFIFTAYGLGTLWTLNATFVSVGIVAWLLYMKRLKAH